MGLLSRFLLLLSFFVSQWSAPLRADVIYVSQRILPVTVDGTSWNTSFQTMEAALNAASAGDEIWVARGRYVPGEAVGDRFVLVEGVSLYGGFQGNEASRAERDWRGHPTVLSGDLDDNDLRDLHGITRSPSAIRGTNAHTVLYLPPSITAATVVDGFVISGGHASVTAGSTGSPNRAGAGIYSAGAEAQLKDLLVIGNLADGRGGGLYLSGSALSGEGLIVQRNQAQYGGGIACYSTSPATFQNCVIQGNESIVDGGGMRVYQSDITGLNLLITGNKARSGGGVSAFDGSPLLVQPTIASNLATLSTGGVSSGADASVALHNAIVWGNALQEVSGTLVIDEATIEGGAAGTGVETASPAFLDLPSSAGAPHLLGDYKVPVTSPIIDKGKNALATAQGLAQALDGASRILDGNDNNASTVDHGAYERYPDDDIRITSASIAILSHGNGLGENPYLINADADNNAGSYDRDGIDVLVSTTFAGTPGASDSFRVYAFLEDAHGIPVPLASNAGKSFQVTPSQTVVANAGGAAAPGFLMTLKPETPLQPTSSYHVRVFVQENVGTFLPFYINRLETRTATGLTLYHFPSTNPNDLLKNVLGEVTSVSFTRFHAIDTVAARESFQARVNFSLWRYDGWTSGDPNQDQSIRVYLRYQLRDAATHEALGLEDTLASGWSEKEVALSMDRFVPGNPTAPSTRFASSILEVNPADGVQLNSISETYYVAVEFSEGPFRQKGNRDESGNAQLLHFNGDLEFAHIRTELQGITNAPESSISGQFATSLTTTLQGVQGELSSSPGFTFGPANDVPVRLGEDGVATVEGLVGHLTVSTPGGDPDEAELGGLCVHRTAHRLSSVGLTANVSVSLPAGMGWTSNSQAMVLEKELGFSQLVLNGFLEPLNTPITYTPPGDFYVMEESKPLLFAAESIDWAPLVGEFKVPNGGTMAVNYVRADEMEALRGLGKPREETFKRSNESYFDGVTQRVGELVVLPDDLDQSAKLSANVSINDLNDYESHFPYGVRFADSFGGVLHVSDDEASGTLENVTRISLAYGSDCPGAEGCAGGSPEDAEFLLDTTDKRLFFTKDGGLVGEGALFGDAALRWGYRGEDNGNAEFTHTTSDFDRAVVVVAGHALGREVGLSSDAYPIPEALLHSGVGSVIVGGVELPNQNDIIRPTEASYGMGQALHPGMNLSVAGTAGVMTCESFVGDGMNPLAYQLSVCSRYYIRQAGVSGVHEADPSVNPEMPVGEGTVYGYPIRLDTYFLSFFKNINEDSKSAGSLAVPGPIDQTFAFEKLTFDCLGGPKEAEPPSASGPRELAYWGHTQFQPLAFVFQSDEVPACGKKFLTVASKVWVPHFENPFYGTLGMLPDGQFMTAASGEVTGIDSRLSVPNRLLIDGPGNESYRLTPYTGIYHSNESRDGGNFSGHLNLMGSLDVAFFDPVDVHLGLTNTAAGHGTPAPIRLTGDWDDENGLAMRSRGHDADNVGFTEAIEKHFTTEEHLPRAQRDWLGAIAFDYPLKWEAQTRSFHSLEPITNDLVVIEGEHQVRFLSAEQADIKFGVLYEGLPEINLANIGYNIVDEATGILSSVETAASDAVASAIDVGMREVEALLAEQPEALLDRAIGDQVETLLGQLHEELRIAWGQAADWEASYEARLDAILFGALGAPGGGEGSFDQTHVLALLANMGGSVEWPEDDYTDVQASGLGLLYHLDESLAQLENSIRALTSGIIVEGGEILALPPIPTVDLPQLDLGFENRGLFSPEAQVQHMQALIHEMLEGLAGELLANIESQFGDFPASQFEEMQGYFDRIEPAMNLLRENLERIRDQISALRMRLREGSDVAVRLNAILKNGAGVASEAVQAVVAEVKAELVAELERLTRLEIEFPELRRDEFIAMAKQRLYDALFSQVILPDIQEIIRDEVRSLEDALVTNMSSLFQQVNQVIRDLVTEYVRGFDVSSVNEFIGELNGVVSGAELQGYAFISGDTLRKLRLDLGAELHIPDDLTFDGYIEVNQEQVGPHLEVLLGAKRVPISWELADESSAMDIDLRFGFNENLVPTDIGGKIDLSEGAIEFSEFTVPSFTAVCGIGAHENYLGAQATLEFTDYEFSGAFFLGSAMSMDPLTSVAGDVSEIIGDVAPFSGVYMYGDGHFPIVGGSCLFKISAGVGAGIWYFDGYNERGRSNQVLGGRLHGSVSGEALCLVSIRGDIDLLGSKSGNDFNFRGTASVSGKAGVCPFCTRFRESVTVTYESGSWDVDY